MSSARLSTALIQILCLISAIILHEVSHGLVALWCGDDTARKAGRLTLNPAPHIDLFGSIIVPAMGALSGIAVIGWAKPVPINPALMKNPRRDSLIVGLAGPASNVALMATSAVIARFWYQSFSTPVWAFGQLPLGIRVITTFAVINLFLAIFNLLPIPPLDGSALIERALPASWLSTWWRIRPYGMLILFLVVFMTNIFGRIVAPFEESLFRFILG